MLLLSLVEALLEADSRSKDVVIVIIHVENEFQKCNPFFFFISFLSSSFPTDSGALQISHKALAFAFEQGNFGFKRLDCLKIE